MDTGAAHRDVVVGKLFPGHLRGGIDRCPAFVDHDDFHRTGKFQCPQKGFGFPAGGAVAHGNGLGLEAPDQVENRLAGLPGAGAAGVGVDGVVVKQLPLAVQAYQLAPRAKPRVQGHDPPCAQGGGQQKLAQVFGKDPDRFGIGPLLGGQSDFGFHGPGKQPFVAVADRLVHLLGIGSGAGDETFGQQGQGVVLGRGRRSD